MRSLMVLGLCGILAGCDRVRVASIAIVPSIAARPDSAASLSSAAQDALSLGARLASKYGLTRHTPTSTGGFSECFADTETLQLCMRTTGSEVEFRLSELLGVSKGEPLRRELADSLRSRFGESRVRVSEWR